MRKILHHKLGHYYKVFRNPSTASLTRIVLVTHIVYYVVAVAGISYAAVHTITSTACAVALALELLFTKGAS